MLVANLESRTEFDLGVAHALFDSRGDRVMHQSIPAAPSSPPPPHRADPRALAFFLPWMGNSLGWGLLSCQISRGGDEEREQMPRPPSTLQHFSLIAQSTSAILSILCNSAILIKTTP